MAAVVAEVAEVAEVVVAEVAEVVAEAVAVAVAVAEAVVVEAEVAEVAVEAAVAVGQPQLGNLKEPILVFQSAEPVVWMYSFVNQKVQSSTGSVAIIE